MTLPTVCSRKLFFPTHDSIFHYTYFIAFPAFAVFPVPPSLGLPVVCACWALELGMLGCAWPCPRELSQSQASVLVSVSGQGVTAILPDLLYIILCIPLVRCPLTAVRCPLTAVRCTLRFLLRFTQLLASVSVFGPRDRERALNISCSWPGRQERA